jgi:hypothetical protein
MSGRTTSAQLSRILAEWTYSERALELVFTVSRPTGAGRGARCAATTKQTDSSCTAHSLDTLLAYLVTMLPTPVAVLAARKISDGRPMR